LEHKFAAAPYRRLLEYSDSLPRNHVVSAVAYDAAGNPSTTPALPSMSFRHLIITRPANQQFLAIGPTITVNYYNFGRSSGINHPEFTLG